MLNLARFLYRTLLLCVWNEFNECATAAADCVFYPHCNIVFDKRKNVQSVRWEQNIIQHFECRIEIKTKKRKMCCGDRMMTQACVHLPEIVNVKWNLRSLKAVLLAAFTSFALHSYDIQYRVFYSNKVAIVRFRMRNISNKRNWSEKH